MTDSTIVGRRIIITGGASGMGAAMVKDFVAHGAVVVSFDINEVDGQKIVDEANRLSGSSESNSGVCHFVPCDVSDQVSVQNAFVKAIELLGGLDGLINAAGIAPGAPAEEITVEDWDRVFAINARGTMLTNQEAFHHLKEHGGRIINFASAAGTAGLKNKAHYSATKGAVLSWTRTVAKEWGQYNITVNSIAPAIHTPMYDLTRSLMTPEQLAALDAHLAAEMPIDGKLGDPDRDLAPVLRFFVSEDSRFITGQTIAVDGGAMMVR